jgi:hypothetical protein
MPSPDSPLAINSEQISKGQRLILTRGSELPGRKRCGYRLLPKEQGGVMAKLKRKERKLTAADLASYGILSKQPDESKPVKSQEPEILDGAAVK